MTLFQIIPNYILINGIAIGGTVFVIFLVYRKLSSSFRKRLTAYFLKAACVSLVISLAVLAAVLTLLQLLLHSGMWDFFHELGYGYLIAAEYLQSVLAVAFPVICFVVSFSVRVNRRVRYVEYLSQEIQKIREEGFGRSMELQGDDEITQLCAVINEMSVQLREKEEREKRQQQSKNELITNVSHDLKTPLTSVIGYLTLLRDERQISEELREKYLTIALAKSERLEDLINEFLEIARYSLSTITLQHSEINLTRLLEQFVYEFQPVLDQKGLTCRLAVGEDILLNCDADKMQRVFDNLLRNAVNYSYDGTEIAIEAESGEDCVTLRFSNHGGTIPKEKLERIFEQFYRLDTGRGSSGTGLGLAIAKQIVALHKGTITAESRDGLTVFTVTLPTVS